MAGRVAHQSERLAALLVLALEPTKGPQRSLVVNTSTGDEDDGVLMWANLIKHFETSTRETRIASLLQLWEREALRQGEYPDELYGRLTAINSRLAGLGEEYTDTKLLMRFVSAVERSEDERYSPATQQYYGAQILGSGYTLDQLREFLARVNATSKAVKMAGPTLKRLATTPKCAHCGKLGHVENDCWTRHPAKAPSRKPDGHKAGRKRLCWECGKEGHIAAECPKKDRSSRDSIVAANVLKEESKEITFIDSACSVHLVESLDILHNVRKLHKTQTVQAVDGHTISLTHKGEREISTNWGTLRLGTVYYAKGIKFRLVSVSELVRNGVRTVFEPHSACIETGDARITLGRDAGLWTVPEVRKARVAALRMGIGGVTDSKTWYWRMGHPSAQKTAKMIERNIVPRTVRPEDASLCTVYRVTNPRRRPVPTTAERSGLATVQVDFMPMGRNEVGWKDEVGAYIFSDRSSKVVQVYPVTSVSAGAAILALEQYLTYVVNSLTDRVECVQTDAGSQFMTDEWSRTCKERGVRSRTCKEGGVRSRMCEERGVRSRTCPVDHQAMNGQVERTQGILCRLMRAMMKTMRVPGEYWPLVLENAAYLFNRTLYSSPGHKNPLEVGTNEVPDTSNVRVFGCKAFVKVPKTRRRGKLANTAWAGVMVGFSTNSPEWLILDPQTMNVRKAYSVTFQERMPGSDDMHGETDNNTEVTTPVYTEENNSDSHIPPPTVPHEDKHSDRGERQSYGGGESSGDGGTDDETTPEIPPSPDLPTSSELSYCTPERI